MSPPPAVVNTSNDSPRDSHHDRDVMDSVSQSATSVFGEEPFKTFQIKITYLCTQLYGFRNVVTEQMKGGSFNRVVGVRCAPSSPQMDKPPPRKKGRFAREASPSHAHDSFWTRMIPQRFKKCHEYIFRIQRLRLSQYGLGHDVAALEYVRKNTKLPIAKVIGWNDSKDNVLEDPYMVQERLPGKTLISIWRDLTGEQFALALRQVMNVHQSLQALKSDRGGVIRPSTGRIKRTRSLFDQVDRFDINHPRLTPEQRAPYPPSKPETTHEFLLELVNRRINHPAQGIVMDEIYYFRKIIHALHIHGFTPDSDRFHFIHSDLYPRNMLAETTNKYNFKLSGVIDWDAPYACFAPAFVAYRAPSYFWAGSSMTESGDLFDPTEESILVEPTDPMAKKLKEQFVRDAGAEWLYYAFTPEYVIARRMFSFLLLTQTSNEDWDEAGSIVEAWRNLHPEDDLDIDEDIYGDLDDISVTDEDGASVDDEASDGTENMAMKDIGVLDEEDVHGSVEDVCDFSQDMGANDGHETEGGKICASDEKGTEVSQNIMTTIADGVVFKGKKRMLREDSSPSESPKSVRDTSPESINQDESALEEKYPITDTNNFKVENTAYVSPFISPATIASVCSEKGIDLVPAPLMDMMVKLANLANDSISTKHAKPLENSSDAELFLLQLLHEGQIRLDARN